MKVTDEAQLAEISQAGPENMDSSGSFRYVDVFLALKGDSFIFTTVCVSPVWWPIHGSSYLHIM